jgi:hypothetical protein
MSCERIGHCDYVKLPDGRWQCATCQTITRRAYPNAPHTYCEKKKHLVPARPSERLCVHRGPEVGSTTCSTCRGHTDLIVFACRLHEKCTAWTPVPGIACCRPGECPDFVENQPIIT